MFRKEAIGFHGCETWDLPKSLGSYLLSFPSYRNIPFGYHRCNTRDLPKPLGSYTLSLQGYLNIPSIKYYYRGSSNGLIWIDFYMGQSCKSVVRNLVLQQWVEIPPPPSLTRPSGLVTRVDEDGVVSSFKVVMNTYGRRMFEWGVCVYSSETGLWTSKRLYFPHCIYYHRSSPTMSLNGILYMWGRDLFYDVPYIGLIVAHDFYSDNNQCRVIPLPEDNIHVRKCLTASGGDVIYIELLSERLKVWMLNDNNYDSSSELWQLSWDINTLPLGFDCFPMGMNPFDADIVYLWSRHHDRFVSGNLKTQEFILHQESENFGSSKGCYRFNPNDSKKCMEDMYFSSKILMLSQFVLPQWMDSVPTIRQTDHPS